MPVSLLHAAATAATAVGLLLGLLVLARTRDLRAAFGVFLDYLLAAGLLRLAGPVPWSAVVVAAGVVLVRKLATARLRALTRPRLPAWVRSAGAQRATRDLTAALHPVGLRSR